MLKLPPSKLTCTGPLCTPLAAAKPRGRTGIWLMAFREGSISMEDAAALGEMALPLHPTLHVNS